MDEDPETLSELPGIADSGSWPAVDRTDQVQVSPEDFDITIPQPSDDEEPSVSPEVQLLRIALNRPVPLKDVATSVELQRVRIAKERTHVHSTRPTEPPGNTTEADGIDAVDESKTEITPVPTKKR